MGTHMIFSIAYHPQIDVQIERVNQVLEDMLKMYDMDKPSKWNILTLGGVYLQQWASSFVVYEFVWGIVW